MERRGFLAAAGMAAAGAWRGTMAFGRANETVNVAVVGLNGQGNAHLWGFQNLPDVRVVALCDVDENVLRKRAAEYEKKTRRTARTVVDMRDLFDDPSIHAVSFATPNHWHALGAIRALQAGKDVYVEKPCSHNVWEGRQLVRAARKYDRMCQHGTQGRSTPCIREAMRLLREGVIGDVHMARALCYKWRDTIGKAGGEQPIPPGVHYDLWLGPAPKKPLLRKRLHYDWHWFWDYGNGDIGNQGVHEMDMARWGLGVGLPRKVESMGGHFLFDDDQETPNTQVSLFRYPEENKLLAFEVRHWITNHEGGFGSGSSNNVGVIFYGSKGYMTVQYFSFKTFLGRERSPGPSGSSGEDRWARFIAAVRSRRREDLGVDIEEGHLSSALCHLANMAYRLGRAIAFDPKTERCVGDDEANAMLARSYRAPYVVPEEV
ncbi:MAG: Gfo/Idh/MocA family oxidoreductase [Planctomycetes bacterium]|nr:Gfo/Idh/MocA family oxidoreductase [Planctomycetota bacterium]